MIFTRDHAQQVVDRRKNQTRRPVKPGEWAFMDVDDPTKILSVIGANGRLKWQVGKDYAAQPGRGVKAIGRTPPIEAIRRERLQEISALDILAEGITLDSPRIILEKWRELWNSIYGKPYRWEDDPEVWCLLFELAERYDALA